MSASLRRFEARDLKSYAEPVILENLAAGNVYFAVQYSDPELLMPQVRPLIYLGRNLNHLNADLFYFQDLDSFRMGIRYDSDFETKRDEFELCDSNGGAYIFEFEKALEELMRCGLRRQLPPSGNVK